MTELIKLSYDIPLCGFVKSRRVECPGIKFEDGRIAYLDHDKKISVCESVASLKKALDNVEIEVL